jgi:peroxiredoxin
MIQKSFPSRMGAPSQWAPTLDLLQRPLGLFGMLLTAACLAFLPAATAVAQTAPLDPVPDTPPAAPFELQTPAGERIALADLQGEILVVNFWATWCPPCRAEMPAMERAWQGLRDKGVRFLAINVDEDKDTVAEFARDTGVTFPLLLDPDGKVTQAWPLRGLPTTFVVDGDGKLRLVALGEREWDAQPVMQQILTLAGEVQAPVIKETDTAPPVTAPAVAPPVTETPANDKLTEDSGEWRGERNE